MQGIGFQIRPLILLLSAIYRGLMIKRDIEVEQESEARIQHFS
jgi:hypothetical protein